MPKAKPAASSKTSARPNTVNGLAGWVEVFKAGTHTDSKGKQYAFSQADLDQVADNHKLGRAPAVIGHPKHNDPAYAWVDGYKREGDSLFAKFTDINPAFASGVESGAYRNRSVSIFKDSEHGWRVRHVGWLGAVPPAIDGLQPVEFAADDDHSFEFSAPGYSLVWGLESLAKLLRGLREQMIAKDGIEAADTVLPQWQIDSALESAQQARQEFQEAEGAPKAVQTSLYSQPTNTGGAMQFTQEQLDAAAEEARKEAETKAAAEFAAKEAELIQLRGERQAERIKTQIDGWKAVGKVLPAEETGLAEFMAALENGASGSTLGEFNFSAADKSEVKKTPAQYFADFMSARAPVVKLGGPVAQAEASGVNQNDAGALGKAAADFMASEEKAGRIVSAAAAVEHVIKSAGR